MEKCLVSKTGPGEIVDGRYVTIERGHLVYLGEVVGVAQTATDTVLKVKFFSGEPWPFDPKLGEVAWPHEPFEEGWEELCGQDSQWPTKAELEEVIREDIKTGEFWDNEEDDEL
jgi:hypothetical protein